MGIIDRIAPEIEMTKIRYKKTEDKTPSSSVDGYAKKDTQR